MPDHRDEITQTFIDAYGSPSGKTVLEIGCGDGRVTRFLSDSPSLTIAFDPDLSRIEEAQQTVPQAHFCSASGLDMPFANESFELVLFTLSLHHHPDCAAALTEAARVLKPEGHLLVLEPLNEGELEQICNIFNDESQVLANAQTAIDASPLHTIGTERFITQWHLEDAQALINWLFDFYVHPFDQSKADQVLASLDTKARNTPLILDDHTILTCLKK